MPPTAAEIRQRAADKYAARTGIAGADLARGIRENAGKWKERAMAAGPNYSAGVTLAIANDSFVNGVNRTAPAVFGESITFESQAKYVAKTAASKNLVGDVAVRNTNIAAAAMTEAGERGLAGSPVNVARMTGNAAALHQDKLDRMAAGG